MRPNPHNRVNNPRKKNITGIRSFSLHNQLLRRPRYRKYSVLKRPPPASHDSQTGHESRPTHQNCPPAFAAARQPPGRARAAPASWRLLRGSPPAGPGAPGEGPTWAPPSALSGAARPSPQPPGHTGPRQRQRRSLPPASRSHATAGASTRPGGAEGSRPRSPRGRRGHAPTAASIRQ